MLSRHPFGVLGTGKRRMLYQWDAAARIIRFSTTADRIKVRRLRNDPRASLHVSSEDHWPSAVAEGEA
ncbi:pyridoxamine 5'-phosphate oxidase family protein [Nonomuraea africana]|uniref:pyridoxamine 5'-phosphate oxidase family protein n=1 Tax=Nonomuraea africana TaxID=46171 RepID=UPI003B5B131C